MLASWKGPAKDAKAGKNKIRVNPRESVVKSPR
jgi:hypothetical protein